MKRQLRSFECAFRGVWYAIKNEAHMRFHMVAGFYVIVFSFFYDFSPARWAILILLIALILAAETLNTCIERLCGLIADRFEPLIKLAKDTAAGAVLVLSVAAAVIAVIFFWNVDVIIRIFAFFAENPLFIVLLAISAFLSVIFVRLGPVGIKAGVRKIIKNKK